MELYFYYFLLFFIAITLSLMAGVMFGWFISLLFFAAFLYFFKTKLWDHS